MVKLRSQPERILSDEIAEAIRTGAYRPGEWLRLVDVEERFNASRFDVRAALNELAVRKAVERQPNRGYRVPDPDRETLRRTRAVRVLLEVEAARQAVARIDEATIEQLVELAARFSEAIETGTQADQSRLNNQFHRLMYAACGNPILEELIWQMRDRYRGSPMTLWPSHDALRRSAAEHHAIVEAIRRQDADAVADLVARHIQKPARAD